MTRKRILFITPYPHDTAASQRFRFEQYMDVLNKNGFDCLQSSFMDFHTWIILYQPGYTIRKFFGLLRGYFHRLMDLKRHAEYDYIFIHREAAPIGPPIFEWVLAKVLGKKIIYDFDDSIWLNNTSKANWMSSTLKWHKKVSRICKWSYKVSCGNQYLLDYARAFNENVFLNPTTIDTQYHTPVSVSNDIPVIGWTGTHSTLKYLDLVLDVLKELSTQKDFVFVVIADQPPTFTMPNLKFVKWKKEDEIQQLNQIDIGIMPLEDNEWAKGKCGFKALQFMALEKPVLVSPVGVNQEIVHHGVQGFQCRSHEDWLEHLSTLLDNQPLRKEMGRKGRQVVLESYSVASNANNFLSLID